MSNINVKLLQSIPRHEVLNTKNLRVVMRSIPKNGTPQNNIGIKGSYLEIKGGL